MTTKTTKTTKTAKKSRPITDKKPFAEEVAERIIAALEQGTAPWQRPWAPGRPGAGMPFNPTTNNAYKGINSLVLLMSSHADTRWMTYKQASALGAQVRKGEKGTTIQYWSFEKSSVRKDGEGKPVKDDGGKSIKDTVRFNRPRVFTASVFNAEQIDGLAPMAIPEESVQGWESVERAEQIFLRSGAKILHADTERAFYSPSRDLINMPERSQFSDAASYYSVLLHELGHWTGHSNRLNRDLTGGFGSVSYAKEELRAEIASMIIGDTLGLGHNPEGHMSYVKSWIDVLKEDPLEIFRAASDADKIKNYVIGFENELKVACELEQEDNEYVSEFSPG